LYKVLPNILKTTIEDVYLFYINIKNAFYNFFLFIHESIKFYPNQLLRKVDIELFKVYAIRDQFQVSIEESKGVSGLEDDLTYGEATWGSVFKIMEFVNPSKDKIFYDLGCGTGRICFFMNIYYGLETWGIDLIPTFIGNAQQISEKFNLKDIHFLQTNWLDIALEKADILYIAGTCLDDNTLKKLIEKLKSLKTGTIVISVSNWLKGEHLELIKTMNLPFSWGWAKVYISKAK
jgi:SAM-dependent methyltransferase